MYRYLFLRRIAFAFLLLFLPLLIYSQVTTDHRDMFLGKWLLEDISVKHSDKSISTNTDSLNIEVYPELEFSSNYLSFSYKGNSIQQKYSFYGDHLIYLNFMTTSFYAEWVILNNKLYMEWSQDIEIQPKDIKTITILLTYKRKAE